MKQKKISRHSHKSSFPIILNFFFNSCLESNFARTELLSENMRENCCDCKIQDPKEPGIFSVLGSLRDVPTKICPLFRNGRKKNRKCCGNLKRNTVHSEQIPYKRVVKIIFWWFLDFFGQKWIFYGSERLHTKNFNKISIGKKLGKIR